MASNIGLAGLIIAASVLVISAEIIRPCSPVTDKCVGNYLSKKSNCSQIHTVSRVPDPYRVEHFYLATPYFNLTEERYNITVTGFSKSYIKDFFCNMSSGRAMMTISVPDLRFEGVTHMHYRQFNKEPIEISTSYKAQFNDLYLNTIFNNNEMLNLADSASYATILKLPTIKTGNELAEAAQKDTRVKFLLSEVARLPMVATQEAFKYRAPALVKLYTQFKLCSY